MNRKLLRNFLVFSLLLALTQFSIPIAAAQAGQAIRE
jgi:hypothetical protein